MVCTLILKFYNRYKLYYDLSLAPSLVENYIILSYSIYIILFIISVISYELKLFLFKQARYYLKKK
jgi:hypothetical protein